MSPIISKIAIYPPLQIVRGEGKQKFQEKRRFEKVYNV